MVCPNCHSERCRRSRRRGPVDRVLGLSGLRPWRCHICDDRFHAWVAPLRFIFYVYCPGCGNMDLQSVARDRVSPGAISALYRLLGFPAYRCGNCRKRFFSLRRFRRIRPLEVEAGAPAAQAQPSAPAAPAQTRTDPAAG